MRATMAQVFTGWMRNNLVNAGLDVDAERLMKDLRDDSTTYEERHVACGHGRFFRPDLKDFYEECETNEGDKSVRALNLWFAGLWTLGKQHVALTKIVGDELPRRGFPASEGLSAQHAWCVEQENLFVAETFTRKALWDAAGSDFQACKDKFVAEESAGWAFFGMTTVAIVVFALVLSIQGTDCAAIPCMQNLLKFCGAEKDGEGADEVGIPVVVRSEEAPADMEKVNEVRPKRQVADSAESSSGSAVNGAVTEGKIQSSTKWSTPSPFIGSPSDGQVSAADEEPMDFSSMLLISGVVVCTLVLFAVVLRRRSRGSARSRQRGGLVVVGKRRGKFHDIL